VASKASYPTGARGSFPGVKQPGREADHSPLTISEVQTSTPPYAFMAYSLIKDGETIYLPYLCTYFITHLLIYFHYLSVPFSFTFFCIVLREPQLNLFQAWWTWLWRVELTHHALLKHFVLSPKVHIFCKVLGSQTGCFCLSAFTWLRFSHAFAARYAGCFLVEFGCVQVIIDCLCGLVVRVPAYTTEMYCDSCEVRTEFIKCYVEESRPPLWSTGQSS
jgi:hypothetical protein